MRMKTKKAQPILKRILIPMILLTLMEVILLSGTFIYGGTIQELNQNARGIVQGKVKNRSSYLKNEMLNNWSNVSYTAQLINARAEELETEGTIDLDKIGSSSQECYPLVSDISKYLIEMIRSNKVTGAFVIFNTDDPDTLRNQENFAKPGVYFRDLDPDTSPSIRNSDLLIERGSVDLVHSLDIATDSMWKPQFEFQKENPETRNILLNPYEQGLLNTDAKSLTEVGYWGKPHTLTDDDKKMISYSVPLVTSQGKVYGVLGMEITLEYLSSMLPSDELMSGKNAVYLLVIKDEEKGTYETAFSSDEKAIPQGSKLQLETSNDGYQYLDLDSRHMFIDTDYLQLYDSNGPFESDRWGLAGVVKERDITEFSRKILHYIALAILFTISIGIGGSIIVSFMISRPIYAVSKNMQRLNTRKKIHLPRTNILEIDQMERSIEKLSSDVIDSATKFTQILNKASVRIAGFELDFKHETLFITDEFFRIFGEESITTKMLDIHSFQKQMESFDAYKVEESDGYALYKIAYEDRDTYIRLSYSELDGQRIVGVAEDITRTIQEKQLLEHERDHDLLTGLKNRRAFQRLMHQLFAKGEDYLKKAALVMIDLDNLKQINDKFGHDYGDKYIQAAADSFRKYTPQETVIARISGDEFYLFFYGYESETEITKLLTKFRKGIAKEYIILPPMQRASLRMSGGISWYPRDSRHYEQLLQYSDFAMYQIKHSTKGEIGNFDLGAYHSEEYISQNRRELTELIEREEVEYFFQPIVDAHTGKIFAYEALMRGTMPTLRSPADILSLAREEHKLDKIEELTWKIATKTFIQHVRNRRISPECKVFINSLADYRLSNQTLELIESECKGYLDHFVLEITEDSQANQEAMDVKRVVVNRWNSDFALDDYGSGYNGERVLLELAPKYIKIDRSIIFGIHINIDKQKIVENTISYAKERNIKVIAEGIETEQELNKVIELGVDYLQGYYLARPDGMPPLINKFTADHIKELNEKMTMHEEIDRDAE